MVFVIILTVILMLILAMGGFLFFTGCLRQKDLPWLDEAALQKTPYGRFYDHISAGHQWLLDHHAQDVSITSRDGLTLHGLWVPAENPRGTMLLVHGYHSCILADFGLVFGFYHDLGLNLLLPDQRCHGKSQGTYTTFGVKESRDMLDWLAFHNRQFGPYPVVLSGLSMGASTVMYMADEPLPENVRGIIADCGFTTPKEIMSAVFTRFCHLPAVPFIWATELFARLFAGFSLTEKSTVKSLAKNRLPILLVHGTADHFVPCDMTRRSYGACSGPKKLLLVEGAGHGVSYLHDKEHYQALVIELLNNVLEDVSCITQP